MKGSKRKIKLN